MADRSNMNDTKPGRLTAVLRTLPIFLSFLNVAIAISIIGLAADSLAWADGRGSMESNTGNTLYAAVLGPTVHGNSTYWYTRMHYLPQYFDTHTFSALVAGGAVCAVVGIVVGSLSIASRITKAPSHTSLLSCLALESVGFLTAIIVLIYARELYATDPVYDGSYREDGDAYRIVPKYFNPALPSDPSMRDETVRYYRSPEHYNPMNWNCRLQGHVNSAEQNRVFNLCQEGIAARGLLPALIGLQGVLLLAHAWGWFVDRGKSGQAGAGQSAEADERVRRLQEEE